MAKQPEADKPLMLAIKEAIATLYVRWGLLPAEIKEAETNMGTVECLRCHTFLEPGQPVLILKGRRIDPGALSSFKNWATDHRRGTHSHEAGQVPFKIYLMPIIRLVPDQWTVDLSKEVETRLFTISKILK